MFVSTESESERAKLQTVASKVLKRQDGESIIESDRLAVEEPLEIAVRNAAGTLSLGVVFRTPGDDENLVAGLLFNEGLVSSFREIVSIRIVQESNATIPACRAIAQLVDSVELDTKRHQRAFPISSACGACGKSALESLSIRRSIPFSDSEGARIREECLAKLPQSLEKRQVGFQSTGGVHAAALFNSEGEILGAAEDIGRHNAMDKLVGGLLRDGDFNWTSKGLLFSGRVGYDLMQKAIMVDCPFIVCIGAPSSFAVELANLLNVTLLGFLRDDRFNVYSAPQRVQLSDTQD